MLPRLLILFLAALTACTSPPPACDLPADKAGARLSDIAQARVRDRLMRAEPAAFRYFYRGFHTEGRREWLVVNFRNHEECFDVKLQVPESEAPVLAGMRRTDGASYPEELRDVKWSVRPVDDYGESVVFEGMRPIVD